MLPMFTAALLLAAPLLQGKTTATARFVPDRAPVGATVELHVHYDVPFGWHVYHPDQDPNLGVPVSVEVPEGFTSVGALTTTRPGIAHHERIGGESYDYLFLDPAGDLVLPLKVGPGPLGEAPVAVSVGWQACNDSSCLPPDRAVLKPSFTRQGAAPPPAAPAPAAELGRAALRAEFVPAHGAPGEPVELHLSLSLPPGYHVYHMSQDPENGIPTSVSLPAGFEAAGPLRSVKPAVKRVEEIGSMTLEYRLLDPGGELVLPLEVAAGAPGDFQTSIEVTYQACNEEACDPVAVAVLPLHFTRDSAPAAAGPTQPSADLGNGAANPLGKGLWVFLLAAAGAGLFSLATPCVFPMIPITVSFFTKRAEAGKGTALGNAFAYGAGIVLTFVGLGLGITAIYGATGVNTFASNPWLNTALAALFVYFAFSLLGFYEIQPPNWLQSRLSRATSQGQQRSGYGPVLVMAVAFSVTAFTCTVAFVGAVLILASQGAWFYAAAGMTVYAVVFAAPFFLLAMFPHGLQRLPQAGGWMNTVKVSMGFVEMIFALKFFSNVDMVKDWQFLTRPVVIVLTAAALLAWALYLFGLYPLPHDHGAAAPSKRRRLFAVVVLVGAGSIGSGLRGGPFPGALEAYFPPPQYGSVDHGKVDMGWYEADPDAVNRLLAEQKDLGVARQLLKDRYQLDGEQLQVFFAPEPGPAGLSWYQNYHVARLHALAEGKPMLVDFTGVTCVNCRRMEGNVMPVPEVHELLTRFVLAELWVDKPPHGSWNKEFQRSRFQAAQQPLYLTIDPASEKVRSRFDGYGPDPEKYADFLRKGLE